MSLARATPQPLPRSRVVTGVGAAITLLRDPKRVDQVLVLGDTVNVAAYKRLGAAMPEIVRERTLWTRRTVDPLRALPAETLGREYARFLDDNKLTPEGLSGPPKIDDEDAAYVALRMRQTHDIWHVLTGYTPDVPGELKMLAFTFAQCKTPASLLIVFFGVLRWMLFYRGLFTSIIKAYRRGKRAKNVSHVRWEDEWTTPVAELRARFAID